MVDDDMSINDVFAVKLFEDDGIKVGRAEFCL